jgi:hypothetical protein
LIIIISLLGWFLEVSLTRDNQDKVAGASIIDRDNQARKILIIKLFTTSLQTLPIL